MQPVQSTTNIIKPSWFGREVSILLSNGKKIRGELSEVGQSYLIINTSNGETQVMVHAIVLLRLAGSENDEESSS